MAFTIISKNNEKTFTHKELVNICSKDGFDFKLDVPFDCMLTVQYDPKTNRCVLLNQYGNDKFLFKGKKGLFRIVWYNRNQRLRDEVFNEKMAYWQEVQGN